MSLPGFTLVDITAGIFPFFTTTTFLRGIIYSEMVASISAFSSDRALEMDCK